jgi:hypothetical protein
MAEHFPTSGEADKKPLFMNSIGLMHTPRIIESYLPMRLFDHGKELYTVCISSAVIAPMLIVNSVLTSYDRCTKTSNKISTMHAHTTSACM